MNELEWLLSEDPADMLEWITKSSIPPPSNRKIRLFACACCRLVWDKLDGQSRQTIEASERFADGKTDRNQLIDWWGRAQDDRITYGLHPEDTDMFEIIHSTCDHGARPGMQAALFRDIVGNPFHLVTLSKVYRTMTHDDGSYSINVPIPCPWLTPTVLAIAQRIYDERAFDDLPIIADALEDAGCEDEEILRHCRGEEPCPKCSGNGWISTPGSVYGPRMNCSEVSTDMWPYGVGCAGSGWDEFRSPHVLGCWALDLVLGKE